MWLVLPLALLVPATAFLFYRLALAPALDSLDHALDGTALALERLVRDDDGRLTLMVSPELDSALRADRYDEVHWVALAPTAACWPATASWRRWAGRRRRWTGASSTRPTTDQPVRVALHGWTCVPATAGRAAGPVRGARLGDAQQAPRRRAAGAGGGVRRRCWSRRWCWR